MPRNPKSQKVECPASYHGGINGTDKVHMTTQAELDANGGVCTKCREKFRKKFNAQQSRSSSSHDTEHHDFDESVAFVDGPGGRGGSHHAEPIVEPMLPADVEVDQQQDDVIDFPILDGQVQPTGLDARGVRILAKFCARLFEIGGRNKEKFFQAAHTCCFAAHIHPEQHLSGEVIAKKFGITKAAFFKQVNRFRDILNLPRIAGAKSNAARKVYSKRMTESHRQRRQGSGAQCAASPGDKDPFTERFSAALRRTATG